MRLWTADVILAVAALLWPLVALAEVTESAPEDEASSDEKIWNLLQLGSKYNKVVRPPPDYNTTNVVYISFIVIKLLGINEVAQHMALEGYTEMEWNDPRLACADYRESKQPLSTIVLADGRVFTSSPYNSRTLCDINMLYFPFDSQVCRVVFGSWLMVKADLELRLLNKNVSSVISPDNVRQQSIESDEYCITKSDFAVTPLSDQGVCQEAVFTIAIQRKPLFYVMNLIVPSFLILFICVFSFFLPPDSGERLSLNITLMLTLMVFMQIVAGYTPAQSDNVPMLTGFFAAVVAITAVSTVGSVFQLYCCYRARASGTVETAAIRAACLCRLQNEKRGKRDDTASDGDEDAVERTHANVQAPQESEWLIAGRRLDWVLFVVMVIAIAALALFICHARNPDYIAC